MYQGRQDDRKMPYNLNFMMTLRSKSKQNEIIMMTTSTYRVYNKYITMNCFKWVWVMLAYTHQFHLLLPFSVYGKQKKDKQIKKRARSKVIPATTLFMGQIKEYKLTPYRKSKTHTHTFSIVSLLNLEFAPVFPGDLMVVRSWNIKRHFVDLKCV